jgi:hypothetical protein
MDILIQHIFKRQLKMHTRQAKWNDYYKGAIWTYMLSNKGIAQHEYNSQEKAYSNQATKDRW